VEILPRALRKFQAEFPRMRVMLHDLSTEEMIAQLHRGKLQLALGVLPSRKMLRGLRFKELASYPICVAVALDHKFARARLVKLEEVAREPLIAYSREDYPEYHATLDSFFNKGKERPRIVEEHESVTSLIAAVEAERGVALVPSCLACMTGPRLKLIPVTPAPPPIVVGALMRNENTPPLVEKLITAAGSGR
jgi:DNA-binding transcriptional LysR family regulator